jgi:hypothetical protein
VHRIAILTAAAVMLVAPATAQATEKPTHTDRVNAAQECRFERGTSAATREAFAAKYRTFGACVSRHARDEASEREHARNGASAACRAERAANRAAFEAKYGTNANKRNAFGKCVSAAAKAKRQQADAADRDAARERKSAARECARERGDTAASRAAFASKYRTFGKCVSRAVRA